MCCNVFNMWPESTPILPVWPRDAKRLDTPGGILVPLCLNSVGHAMETPRAHPASSVWATSRQAPPAGLTPPPSPFFCGLLIRRSEGVGRLDASSSPVLTTTARRLMGVAGLCPPGPRSPFRNLAALCYLRSSFLRDVRAPLLCTAHVGSGVSSITQSLRFLLQWKCTLMRQ